MNPNAVKTNFGSINGHRVITFRDTTDRRVVPAKFKDFDASTFISCFGTRELITARESFRRWKIARAAWRTRKGNTAQLYLSLNP